MTESPKYPHDTWEGIVLKLRKSGDHDAVLTVFDRNQGIGVFFAKSLHKPLAKLQSILQPLYLVNITFIQGRGLPRIIGGVVLDAYASLRHDPLKIWIMSYMGEFLVRLIPDKEPDPSLYDLFARSLSEAHSLDPQTLFLSMEWRIVDLLGFDLDFTKCLTCRTEFGPCPQRVFLEEGGGLICSTCYSQGRGGREIAEDLFRTLVHFQCGNPARLKGVRLSQDQFRRLSSLSLFRLHASGFSTMPGREKLIQLLNQAYVDKKE